MVKKEGKEYVGSGTYVLTLLPHFPTAAAGHAPYEHILCEKTEEKKIGRKKFRQKWIVDEGENSCWEQVLQKMDT